MRLAIQAGANIINDVNALQTEGALETAVALQVPVCLMHKQGTPNTMQVQPTYQNVVEEVKGFLQQRIDACRQAGMAREYIWVDPGFGFGKTLQHNLQLLHGLNQLQTLGYPLLVGLSRKAMLGELLQQPPQARLHGSLALAVYAAIQGAQVIRVHDVKATMEALRCTMAVMQAGELWYE